MCALNEYALMPAQVRVCVCAPVHSRTEYTNDGGSSSSNGDMSHTYDARATMLCALADMCVRAVVDTQMCDKIPYNEKGLTKNINVFYNIRCQH